MLCVQKAQCKLKPPSFAPPCVDKTEDVQERNGMRIPPPLTRTWYVSERTEKRRAGQTEGLHLLLTVTVTSSPLKTMLHISLSSQPDLRRGHWPGIMMWSEVNICHGDKADSSKTTFWMMNKWEKCQFTITHSANGVLRHLWSPPFISLSHAMKTQGDLQSFSVFSPSAEYPSSTDYDLTLHHIVPWVFPVRNFAPSPKKLGAPRWAGNGVLFARLFSHCGWPTNTANSSSSQGLYGETQSQSWDKHLPGHTFLTEKLKTNPHWIDV